MTPDERIKKLFPVGMRDSVDIALELRCGFELFNTRPYHNYETWSNGWYAKCDGKVVASGETLDDLCASLELWAAAPDGSYLTADNPTHISYRTWRKALTEGGR